MKQILISIKPEWVAKILNGEKTIEVRKTIPQEIRKCLQDYKCTKNIEPYEVFIYCSKGKNLLLDNDDKKYYYNPECYNQNDIFLNGKVVAKFVLNKADVVECNNVPYSEKAHFGYSYHLDNGVYFNPYVKEYKERHKPYNCDNGLVFERKYTKRIEILKNQDFEKMCIKPQEIFKYLNYSFNDICLFYIDNLEIFDKPKQLSEFNLKKAPQSWCYCEYIGRK